MCRVDEKERKHSHLEVKVGVCCKQTGSYDKLSNDADYSQQTLEGKDPSQLSQRVDNYSND